MMIIEDVVLGSLKFFPLQFQLQESLKITGFLSDKSEPFAHAHYHFHILQAHTIYRLVTGPEREGQSQEVLTISWVPEGSLKSV